MATPDDLLLNWVNNAAKFSLASEKSTTLIEQAIVSVFASSDTLSYKDTLSALGTFLKLRNQLVKNIFQKLYLKNW